MDIKETKKTVDIKDYEILKSQKDYYKNEYDLIAIELKKKNTEIKRLMKIISDYERR